MSATSYQALTRPQIIGTMAGVLLTLFLSSLDVTIVSTAMPRIIGQLEGFDRYAWVTTAYLLTATAGIPIFGKLMDGTATNTIVIVNMTVVGVGLGLTSPIYTVIVQNVVERRQLGVATAAVTFAGRIGSTLGVTLFSAIMLSRYRAEFDSSVPVAMPDELLHTFDDPLQLGQVLPQLRIDAAGLPNGTELLTGLLAASNDALVSALNAVFLVSAFLAVLAFAMNLRLVDIPLLASWSETAARPHKGELHRHSSDQPVPVGSPAPLSATIDADCAVGDNRFGH